MVTIKIEDNVDEKATNEHAAEWRKEKPVAIILFHCLIPVLVFVLGLVMSHFEKAIKIVAPVSYVLTQMYPFLIAISLEHITGQKYDINTIVTIVYGAVYGLGVLNLFSLSLATNGILKQKPNYFISLIITALANGAFLISIWMFYSEFARILAGPLGWCDYVIWLALLILIIIEIWSLNILVNFRRRMLAKEKEVNKAVQTDQITIMK